MKGGRRKAEGGKENTPSKSRVNPASELSHSAFRTPHSELRIPPSEEPIAAVASALGGSARAIVRISGPAAVRLLNELFEPTSPSENLSTMPERRGGALRIPGLAATVPCEAFVWPTVRSYTRQPTVELHFVGSPPLVDAVLGEACRRGARPARPGEFTLRAFLAGRLDLAQAEAVLGVVDAVERRQLDVALRQMSGGLSGPLERIRNELLDVTAHLEAGLDFTEEDITFIGRRELLEHVRRAEGEVRELLAQVVGRGDANELPQVVLIGRPNVGKSSLFNALAARGEAIVSPTAGTTRDYLSMRVTLAGVDYELIDTAGLDATIAAEHAVEQAAQSQTHRRLLEADVRLFCLDASQPLDAWERRQLSQADPQRLVVRTKTDLADAVERVSAEFAPSVSVSVRTDAGLAELRDAIRRAIVESRTHSSEVVAATAVRCRDGLERLLSVLAAAADLAEREAGGKLAGEELIAVELRSALDELGRLVGTIYTDDILDRIFSRFCIGK